MYYDDYLDKIEKGECIKKQIAGSHKDVVCLTTGKIFNKIINAANYYGVNASGITRCCKGKIKNCGKLPDGEKLQWMYYNDFIKMPTEEQNEILSRNQESSNDGSFIM